MKVKFYAELRKKINMVETDVNLETPISINNLIDLLSLQINPIIKEKLIRGEEVIKGAMILVNGTNIFHLNKLNTIVSNNDEVNLFPPTGCGKNLF